METMIISNIVLLVAIPVLPVIVAQNRRVNNSAFKRVKLKHLAFLFCAPVITSVAKEGIALPIFISQLIGYFLFILLGILDLLLSLISPALFIIMSFVICITAVVELVSLAILDFVLLKLSQSRISRSKQYFKRDKCQKNRKKKTTHSVSIEDLFEQSNRPEFLYDDTGIFAIKYAGATYFCQRNTHQNVIALLDGNGAVAVEYKYDAWGYNCKTTVVNPTATEIAALNLRPFVSDEGKTYFFPATVNESKQYSKQNKGQKKKK